MTTKTSMRKIVRIDEDKCNGCGECVPSCAEGAIQIIDGKARLVGDNLCDGLGNCLGTCPMDAITIEERPAAAFDEVAVEKHLEQDTIDKKPEANRTEKDYAAPELPCGCPGTMARELAPQSAAAEPGHAAPSRLGQWPVQLSLLPAGGKFWQGADVLIAADCVDYAMGDFHDRLLAGKTLAVACPKLDDTAPYVEKLAAVFADNDIASLTVARMEVPCCMGIVAGVRQALQQAGKEGLAMKEIIVSVDGQILQE